MEGYEVGQVPPELAEDGSFEVKGFQGLRAYSIVDSNGNALVVDKKTRKLVVSEDEDDCA